MSAPEQPTIEERKLAQETLASYGVYAPVGKAWELLQEKGLELIEPEPPSDPAFLGEEQPEEERVALQALARSRQAQVVSSTTSTTETSAGTQARSQGQDAGQLAGQDAMGNQFVGPGEVTTAAGRPRPARGSEEETRKAEQRQAKAEQAKAKE